MQKLHARKIGDENSNLYLELYFTNCVGSSTWHQLRVGEDSNASVEVGLFVPF